MKVYIIREKKEIMATGIYDVSSGRLTVKKGSMLSADISTAEKFRGAKSVGKNREGIVDKCILQKDVEFKSPSTAANFVTGISTNGLVAWKTKDGKTLKDALKEVEV